MGDLLLCERISLLLESSRTRLCTVNFFSTRTEVPWSTESVHSPGSNSKILAQCIPEPARNSAIAACDISVEGLLCQNCLVGFLHLGAATPDLARGEDRSEASMDAFYAWLAPGKASACGWQSWTCGSRCSTRRSNRSTHRRPPSCSTQGRRSLKLLLKANKRLSTTYCKTENKVALGFVKGLNNKIRVIQRRSYGLRNEECLRLKVFTCMLPPI